MFPCTKTIKNTPKYLCFFIFSHFSYFLKKIFDYLSVRNQKKFCADCKTISLYSRSIGFWKVIAPNQRSNSGRCYWIPEQNRDPWYLCWQLVSAVYCAGAGQILIKLRHRQYAAANILNKNICNIACWMYVDLVVIPSSILLLICQHSAQHNFRASQSWLGKIRTNK